MWGYAIIDSGFIKNFNFSFSSQKSDILVHLSQWQYWWWFWFSLVWGLYFFLIISLLTKRSSTFNPVLNSSLRGHGKWGDFLIAILPLSWCCNILINSNFILRMLEWQNEVALFTLRIQGKQWYWVYKLDTAAISSLSVVPKNIGDDRWVMGVVDSAYYSANYAQVLSLVAQLEYRTLYQKSLKECDITRAFIQRCGWGGLNTIGFEVMCDFIMSDRLDNNTDNMSFYTFNPVDELSNLRHNILTALDNPSLWISKHQLSEHVLDLISKPTEIDNLVLFSAHFTIDGSDLLKKDGGRGTFWGFKQKRSKKYGESIESLLIRFFFEDFITKKVAPLEQKLSSELLTTFIAETVEADIYFLLGRDRTFLELSQAFNLDHSFIESEVSYLIQNNIIKPHDVLSITLNDNHVAGDEYITNFFFKKQLGRSELTPATLSRRLIRTKRILVLPAHINITVLTNSYDVVHSWFIPGLGLKLDCVPGRSTHHTLFIDNVGFYYGQCAEICGRYHHHMPVTLCALPFEQFVLWWKKKGINRLSAVD